MRKFSSSTNHS